MNQTQNPPAFALRLASDKDPDSLFRLEKACFDHERRDAESTILRNLARARTEVWLAESGQAVIGSLVLHQNRKSLRIYSISVDPAWQGKGIGDALITHALRRARESQLARITLEVAADNKRLLQWYRRLGFRPIRNLPDYYAPAVHAVRLLLSL